MRGSKISDITLTKTSKTIRYRKLALQALCCLVVLFISTLSTAQNQTSFRTKKIAITGDTIQLDSFTIAPNTEVLKLGGALLDTTSYSIDYPSGQLIWKKALPKDSLTCYYRVFPLNLAQAQSNKDIKQLEPDASGQLNSLTYATQSSADALFEMGNLNKSGSISRGIAFGNNQDLSVNSNLNLELSGRLNDKVSILASVTDDNIPIQPDGNTQQLQDFDQVFIQLYTDNSKLIAGDFQLRRPKSYFMNYFKRAQGGTGSTQFYLGPQRVPGEESSRPYKVKLEAGGAASKGKFSRNIIQGIEGNQGPYKLTGADNELFIIVLSGTEKVYIDGQLLTRGQSDDYIIDYNTAELTFTPNQLITKDKRISVEFQYSDRNYARSLFHVGGEISNDKLSVRLNAYSEQDSKNQPLQQELDDFDREVLRQVGDSLQQAVVRAIDSVGFSNERVLYALVDTLGYDSVLVFSTNPDSAIYQAAFSNVGAGNGDYNIGELVASGRIYEWVKPDTAADGRIIHRGSHEPLILLIAPKQRQMVTLAADYKLSDKTMVGAELAYSNNDVNTFSTRDAADDQGIAVHSYIKNTTKLQDKENAWQLVSTADVEFTDRNFTFIERYRPVEFTRNWNVQNLALEGDQFIGQAGLSLQRKENGRFGYTFNNFVSGNEYQGFKHQLLSDTRFKDFKVKFDGSLLNSQGDNTTEFLRHRSLISKNISFLTITFKDEHEFNRFEDTTGDSLLLNSYRFYDWSFTISNHDTAKNKYSVFYQQRTDWAVQSDNFTRATFAESYGGTIELLKNRKSQLKIKTAFRQLSIIDSVLTNQAPDNTLVSRLEYGLRAIKGVITSNTFYEIGTGLEQKQEFVYLEVPAGQGVYTWIDYNDNGVRELNEFEVAAFSDQATFIRVFTQSNEFVKTFSNQFSQTLNIRPANIWRNDSSKILSFLSKVSDQANYRVERKTSARDGLDTYNPFFSDIADTSLLTLTSSFRNTVSFNRSNSKWGIDHTYQDVSSKTLLTSGFDSRSNISNEIRLRWNITKQFTFLSENELGTRSSSSDFLNGRNFSIDIASTNGRFSYQPSTSFRISVLAEYAEKENTAELGGEKAIVRDFGTELRYTQINKEV